MKLTERIKIISAILLIICIVLPISSCSRYVDSVGKQIIKYDQEAYLYAKRITTYNYPFSRFNPQDIYAWLLLICFMWPIPIIMYRDKGAIKIIKSIFWGIEPLFALGSSYYIWLNASLFARPFIGAYLAILANAIYAMVWFSEFLSKITFKLAHHR